MLAIAKMKIKQLTLTKPKKCSLNGSGLDSIDPFMPLSKLLLVYKKNNMPNFNNQFYHFLFVFRLQWANGSALKN